MRVRILLLLSALAMAACAEAVPAPPTSVAGGNLAGLSFDVHQEPG